MSSIIPGPAEASPERPWPAERVELWSSERLIPYGANPRLHSETDVEKIAASMIGGILTVRSARLSRLFMHAPGF